MSCSSLRPHGPIGRRPFFSELLPFTCLTRELPLYLQYIPFSLFPIFQIQKFWKRLETNASAVFTYDFGFRGIGCSLARKFPKNAFKKCISFERSQQCNQELFCGFAGTIAKCCDVRITYLLSPDSNQIFARDVLAGTTELLWYKYLKFKRTVLNEQ